MRFIGLSSGSKARTKWRSGLGVGRSRRRVVATFGVASVLVGVGASAWAGDYLTAQLVVGDPTALSSGDSALQTILQGEGYTVQLVDDDAGVTASSGATDLVVIGASTLGTSLGSKYGPVDVPEVVMASTAWDSMGLTQDDGSFYDSTSLSWVSTSNPIAAWLPSPVQVVPTDRPMRSMVAAKLADGATPVAVRATNTSQNVIFTLDTGDGLTVGTAPARRAVAGLSDPTLANLTLDGTQLVVNLVTWAAEGDAPLKQAATASTVCSTFSSPVACYEMNDPGTTMVDSTSPASSLTNATGTSAPGGVKKVQRNASFAEYFVSGWKGHTSTSASNLGELSGTDTLPADYGQAVIDKSSVTSGETFNPGKGNWQIATRIKPYLVNIAGQTGKHLPAPSTCTGCGPDAPSYNLIQKGRSGTSIPGGFYKIEIMGYAGSSHGLNYVKGSVHCVFRDGDGTTYDAFSSQATSQNKVIIDDSHYYTISCSRVDSVVQLKVTDQFSSQPPTETVTATRTADGATTTNCNCSATTLDFVSPSNGADATAFSPLFSIGKKPKSTHIEDSFSGWIDYVVLAGA